MPVNPTVLFIGLIVLAVASGVGEYFKVLPVGTAGTIVGAVVGGSLYHVAHVSTIKSSSDNKNNQGGEAQ